MSKLIALVATAVMVHGQRTIIQPGETLPDLGPHDTRALQAVGAASNPLAEDAQARAERNAELDAAEDFEEERQKVLAANGSIKPQPDQPDQADQADQVPATAAAVGGPAGKTTTKKR